MTEGKSTGLEQGAANRAAIAKIKKQYDSGQIDREEAKRLAQPILDRINKRSAEIAQKHGNANYYRLDFVSAMRNNY